MKNIICFLLLLPTFSLATNYYIHDDASGDGTIATPWTFEELITNIATPGAGDSVLFKCGDTLIVTTTIQPAAGVIFSKYGTGALPILDAEDTANPIFYINSKNNVEIRNLWTKRAVTSCLDFAGTSSGGIVYNVRADSSGNQGFQNQNTASTTYFNVSATGNADDGFSMHDQSVAVINGICNFDGNADGINTGGTISLTINGIISAQHNTTEGIYLTETGTATMASTATLNVSGCQYGIYLQDTAVMTLFNVTATGCTGGSIMQTGGTLTINTIETDHKGRFTGGTATFYKWWSHDTNIIAEHIHDVNGGSVTVYSSIFEDAPGSNKFLFVTRDGSVNSFINCIFNGNNTSNRLFYSIGDDIVKNCVFTGSVQGFWAETGNGASVSNCTFYGNTSNYTGTFTKSNLYTFDPLFTDEPNSNYTIPANSPAIDAGIDAGASYRYDYTGSDQYGDGRWDVGVYRFKKFGVVIL